MSGLLALLDDVAAIARAAAASVDDIAGQAAKTSAKLAGGVIDDAAKAGAKAAGAVVDDAAVTPKYVQGLPAARELPIVGRIALGSIRNKLLILLPVALLLSAFAPWAIAPLLMLGGLYLCYEGAEKLLHAFGPPAAPDPAAPADPRHLEETRVRGAIKTDFILSAEIMTIALAALPAAAIWVQALSLALVAVAITALVYGAVALIVKADDLGLMLAQGRSALLRALGRAIVRGMPGFLSALTAVGTAAMLWVGGAIVLHALAGMGLAGPADLVHHLAHLAGPLDWGLDALLNGALGVAMGAALVRGLALLPTGAH